MRRHPGITCRPIWMSLKRETQPLLVSPVLTPFKSSSNASISLSLSLVLTLTWEGSISPQSTWLNPNVMELAKAQDFVSCLLTLDWISGGSRRFSSQGFNHHSLIGDLNPADLVEMDCNTAERGWPHFSLSWVESALPQRKVSRHCGEDFEKESCSELSGSFVKHICSVHKHTFPDDSSLGGGWHRGRHLDPEDCWCSGSFVTKHLYRPEYESCSYSSSASGRSKHKKDKECCSSIRSISHN